MPTLTWTIEEVKGALPDVMVLLSDGSSVPGQLSGRALDCATVSYRDGHRTTARFDVAWSTVVRALNESDGYIRA